MSFVVGLLHFVTSVVIFCLGRIDTIDTVLSELFSVLHIVK